MRRFSPLPITLFLALAAISLWAFKSFEKPTVIATVDLERLYNGLDEHKAGEKRLEETMKELGAKSEKLGLAIQSLQSELENFKADSPGFFETSNKIEDAIGNFKAFEEFSKYKFENEKKILLRGTYQAIKSSLGDICKAQQIDAVFLDDATPPFDPKDTRPVMTQISGRRMLWVNPAIDISDVVIKQMNENFSKRQGK
ncbi:MAG: OmpH family outer membrane protein [Phycisphaerales bacterium]|nr:OmpH family outer membrane protein [Phycisphaerales bacterium]